MNVAVFVLQMIMGSGMIMYFGLTPAKVVREFWAWQIFSYMFLHGNLLHLLFNMYILWFFGQSIERVMRSSAFLRFYILCGVGGAVFNVLLSPNDFTPIVGASAAILGVITAYGLIFPYDIIYVFFLFPMRARYAIILFAVMEMAFAYSGARTGIANLAHLGGMLTGFLYLKWGDFHIRGLLNKLLSKWAEKERRKHQVQFHDLSQEVDRILDKVLQKGADSLTRQERDLMQRYANTKKSNQ